MLSSILANEYRNYLEKKINKIKYDPRIYNISNEIFCKPKTTSSLKKIENHLSPCISGIIQKISKERHLKYNDRQTLVRFFKDAGISVDETIDFFRSNFNCSRDKFDKEYLYSIRHNYGLEGKRANYSCFGCQKIATQKPSFGCPFLNNNEYLNDFLKSKNINFDIEDSNYQLNCSKVLSMITEKEISFITSPIDYLKKSMNIEEKKEN